MTQMSHTEPVHAISVYFRRTPDNRQSRTLRYDVIERCRSGWILVSNVSQGWLYVITWVKKRFLQLTPFNPLYSQIFRENFAKNFPEPDCTEHTLDIVNLRNRDDPEHNWTFALFSVTLLVWRKRHIKDNPLVYLSWPKLLAPKEKTHSKCDFRFPLQPKKLHHNRVFSQ